MKCANCGTDVKKKDRDANHGHCPTCHRLFVTDPQQDGITDMQIKKAEDAVSGNGMFYFSKEQLKYQLERKLRKNKRNAGIAAVVLLVIFLFALIFTIRQGGFFIPLTMFSGFIGLAVLAGKSKFSKAIAGLDAVLNRWIVTNPHPKLLKAGRYQNNSQNANLDNVSFDRVLVCDKNETVDFFLSNLFHFHYSCPVLGGNGYPQGIYQDMLARLKQNPNLKVFLLHDYSPQGYAFVRRVKTDRLWFGDGRRYDIVDLGLNVQQKKMFNAMTNKQKDRNGKIKETAEISLFQPAMLVALCGAAINEGVALDQVQQIAAANQHHDGYG
ncbi:hypothetical protein BAC3_02426 [uncultured bacterium]|nr:hypothetical protein BAC3_02426 [uncultured bacterium]